jgi:folate-dependent phosphoribosylglycinamide formyltransferase PurN
MKIVLLTRTGFHHTYFINRLQERFEISCVVREAYPRAKREGLVASLLKGLPQRGGSDEKKGAAFLRQFHEKYSAGFRFHTVLKDYLRSPFDLVVERPGTKYLDLECGEIHSNGFASFLKEVAPDMVVVLGSSVIKPHLIAIPAKGMINIHSGLSPYYRGTWSYGWPIVNREPEYIGVTVHAVDPGIDTGGIIFQTRPALHPDDDLNTIFLKVIAEGVDLAADAVECFAEGSVRLHPQPGDTGRLYLTKDFNAGVARLCLSLLEEGIIGRYLARKVAADSAVPLLGYIPPKLFV